MFSYYFTATRGGRRRHDVRRQDLAEGFVGGPMSRWQRFYWRLARPWRFTECLAVPAFGLIIGFWHVLHHGLCMSAVIDQWFRKKAASPSAWLDGQLGTWSS
ncbi:MAG: hypothetical protein ACLTMP_06320 [Eggerthella lenta]